MKRSIVVFLVLAVMVLGVTGIASAEYHGGIDPFSVRVKSR